MWCPNFRLYCCSDLQARTEAVKSALQLVCSAIADKNATALGEAVRNCPPENTTALSTALAQNAANVETCPTVASVGDVDWVGYQVVFADTMSRHM
jgi:hypothetical protein